MLFDHCGSEEKTLFFIGFDEDTFAARVVDDVFIGDPVRHRNDDFIARIHQRLGVVEKHMLAADGDDAFRRLIVGTELGFVAGNHCLLEFRSATSGGIFGEIFVDGADSRLLDVVGGGEIRLACAEVDDIDSFTAQFVGIGHDFHGAGNADE